MANEKRLIDANGLKRRLLALATGFHTNVLLVDAIIDHINTESTVDAVEVVRCKDCKMEYGCRVAQWLGENGFCSYGERRTDGKE